MRNEEDRSNNATNTSRFLRRHFQSSPNKSDREPAYVAPKGSNAGCITNSLRPLKQKYNPHSVVNAARRLDGRLLQTYPLPWDVHAAVHAPPWRERHINSAAAPIIVGMFLVKR